MLLFFSAFADYDGQRSLASAAFWVSLIGVLVPICQLLEQRLVTPIMKTVYTHGCNPRAMRATARVTLRVMKVGPRRGDSWLKRMPFDACTPYLPTPA